MIPLSIRDALRYEPATGVIRWLIDGKVFCAGQVAGSLHHSGYWSVQFERRRYQAHRIAWVLMTGAEAPGQIDHINLDKADNRWSNLRLASPSLNQANVRGRGDCKKGVTLHGGGRFQAQIKKDGKSYYLGLFGSELEANAAYVGEAKVLFGDFARPA